MEAAGAYDEAGALYDDVLYDGVLYDALEMVAAPWRFPRYPVVAGARGLVLKPA